jgi:hypothetical protein
MVVKRGTRTKQQGLGSAAEEITQMFAKPAAASIIAQEIAIFL